ncbi:MAG: GNAT family N-acetyltransferase, partial [Brachybacterium sp.]|nr:GNAT family N-acetyltransferase [Brachybacterium sp.]
MLRDEDFPAYGTLLRERIFDEGEADYVFPWYDRDPDERVRGALQFQWHMRSALKPEQWHLPFGVWVDDELVGSQEVNANDFARRRVIGSGSWLTQRVHGRGFGSLMRRAMLVLAFDHFGARRAESAAVLGNTRSFHVSRACGYVENGTQVIVEGERVLTHQGFVLTPEDFVRPEVEVSVEGLTPTLREMLGAPRAV